MKTKIYIAIVAIATFLFTSCGNTDINDTKTLDTLKDEINTAVEDGDKIVTINMKCSAPKNVSWDIYYAEVFYLNKEGEERIYTIPFLDKDTQREDKSLIDAALVNYESSPESAQKFAIKNKKQLIKSKGRNIADYDYSEVQANIKQSLEIMKEIEVTDIKGLDNYTIYFGEDSTTDTHEWTILTFSSSKKEGMLVTKNYIKYTFTADTDGNVILTK